MSSISINICNAREKESVKGHEIKLHIQGKGRGGEVLIKPGLSSRITMFPDYSKFLML